MGKPLSEEAKRKISEAFARRREMKESLAQTPVSQSQPRSLGNIVSIKEGDREKLAEMGSLVQQGKAKWSHYANDTHHYETLR